MIVYYCSQRLQVSQAKSGKPYQPIGYEFSQTSLLWLHCISCFASLAHLLEQTSTILLSTSRSRSCSASTEQQPRSTLTCDLLTHYKFKLFCLGSTWMMDHFVVKLFCFTSIVRWINLIILETVYRLQTVTSCHTMSRHQQLYSSSRPHNVTADVIVFVTCTASSWC